MHGYLRAHRITLDHIIGLLGSLAKHNILAIFGKDIFGGAANGLGGIFRLRSIFRLGGIFGFFRIGGLGGEEGAHHIALLGTDGNIGPGAIVRMHGHLRAHGITLDHVIGLLGSLAKHNILAIFGEDIFHGVANRLGGIFRLGSILRLRGFAAGGALLQIEGHVVISGNQIFSAGNECIAAGNNHVFIGLVGAGNNAAGSLEGKSAIGIEGYLEFDAGEFGSRLHDAVLISADERPGAGFNLVFGLGGIFRLGGVFGFGGVFGLLSGAGSSGGEEGAHHIALLGADGNIRPGAVIRIHSHLRANRIALDDVIGLLGSLAKHNILAISSKDIFDCTGGRRSGFAGIGGFGFFWRSGFFIFHVFQASNGHIPQLAFHVYAGPAGRNGEYHAHLGAGRISGDHGSGHLGAGIQLQFFILDHIFIGLGSGSGGGSRRGGRSGRQIIRIHKALGAVDADIGPAIFHIINGNGSAIFISAKHGAAIGGGAQRQAGLGAGHIPGGGIGVGLGQIAGIDKAFHAIGAHLGPAVRRRKHFHGGILGKQRQNLAGLAGIGPIAQIDALAVAHIHGGGLLGGFFRQRHRQHGRYAQNKRAQNAHHFLEIHVETSWYIFFQYII